VDHPARQRVASRRRCRADAAAPEDFDGETGPADVAVIRGANDCRTPVAFRKATKIVQEMVEAVDQHSSNGNVPMSNTLISSAPSSMPRVALFVTCLADAMRPSVGFAALKLLQDAGCKVEVPMQQTCCGQPAFNSGDTKDAAALARRFIELFEPYDYVVAPSGSCVGMTRAHYPEALADDPAWAERAHRLGARTFELMSFLVDVMHYRPTGVTLPATATYHDSCSGLRELGVHDQPRALLGAVGGLEMRPLEGNDVCCGFGGTFCVKYSAISNAVVSEKAAAIEHTGAQLLLGGDLGCLMNMAGKLSRNGSKVRVFHAIEVLAGMTELPAIGEER
jgi:L-lactate dehydrogenase complex protein LldE